MIVKKLRNVILRHNKKIKVLHAPVNVGNQPWMLSRFERELGLESDLIVNSATWLQYPADKYLGHYGERSIQNKLKRFYAAITTPFKYDILHYYFGRSFMCWDDLEVFNLLKFSDLKLAKILGKKVFMTLQGCDTRIATQSNKRNEFTACRENTCSMYHQCCDVVDYKRNELINKILPLCDQIFFLNPELGHYIKKGHFLPYANVDVEKISISPISLKNKPLIIHAPSNPSIKGTTHIEAALASLKKQYDFDYLRISNMPHSEAMKCYESADLIIDQLLLGWYGGFAVEVMAMGKPVLCNIRDEDLQFIPKEMSLEIPILRIDPNNLVDQIKNVLEARTQWKRWGQKSREYVLKWHNPRLIAQAMQKAYDCPESKFSLLV